jgi:hypothetical protein
LRVLNTAAEPFEKALGVLWLRKFPGAGGADVVRVFKRAGPNEGRWVDATPQEIEAGHFHKNYDEWQAAGGVFPIVERTSNAA